MTQETANPRKMASFGAMALVLAMMLLCLFGCQNNRWRTQLKTNLPELGHRNWVVVADSAYPKQNSSGIRTVVTGRDQIDVLEKVLGAIEAAPHVRAIVQLDAELEHVVEADAPGVEAYRKDLEELLQGSTVRVKPHEAIIADLDEASKMFNVLVLKTTMTVPYTSVFFQLDCAYWSEKQENRLRRAIEDAVR